VVIAGPWQGSWRTLQRNRWLLTVPQRRVFGEVISLGAIAARLRQSLRRLGANRAGRNPDFRFK
jgi:hypothetical protein